MSKVFLDTNFFIYAFEMQGIVSKRCLQIIDSLELRGDEILTSALVHAELMVKPTKDHDISFLVKYEKFFTSPTVTVLPFGVSEAKTFAQLRATEILNAPDAIHLACAAVAKTDLFISSDISLTKKKVPGIHFICTPDTAPL